MEKVLEIIKENKILNSDKLLINKIKSNYLEIKIQKKIKELNEILKQEKIPIEIIKEKFNSSKTSINGLSFFSKREFNELIKNEKSLDIINFFKFFSLILENKIYLCENENKNENENENENNFIMLFLERTFPEDFDMSIINI